MVCDFIIILYHNLLLSLWCCAYIYYYDDRRLTKKNPIFFLALTKKYLYARRRTTLITEKLFFITLGIWVVETLLYSYYNTIAFNNNIRVSFSKINLHTRGFYGLNLRDLRRFILNLIIVCIFCIKILCHVVPIKYIIIITSKRCPIYTIQNKKSNHYNS